MSDMISRADAIAACQVGPSDVWSRSTKSGYSQAATDCTMNILRIKPVALPAVEVGVKPECSHINRDAQSVCWDCGYDARIRSALTVQPSPDVAGLVEVLRYYETQFCEGFCEDMPDRSVTNEGMENDCGGCKARAALARMKEAGE